jgi:hypothetical protein
MRLRETGETLMQWLIATPDATIVAGVTFMDQRLVAVAEKFLASISVTDEE